MLKELLASTPPTCYANVGAGIMHHRLSSSGIVVSCCDLVKTVMLIVDICRTCYAALDVVVNGRGVGSLWWCWCKPLQQYWQNWIWLSFLLTCPERNKRAPLGCIPCFWYSSICTTSSEWVSVSTVNGYSFSWWVVEDLGCCLMLFWMLLLVMLKRELAMKNPDRKVVRSDVCCWMCMMNHWLDWVLILGSGKAHHLLPDGCILLSNHSFDFWVSVSHYQLLQCHCLVQATKLMQLSKSVPRQKKVTSCTQNCTVWFVLFHAFFTVYSPTPSK